MEGILPQLKSLLFHKGIVYSLFKIVPIFCFLFLFSFLFHSPVYAASYCTTSSGNCYVDGVGGLDTNDGKTTTTAWKTIQKAATTVGAGDTVNVKGGITYDESVTFPTSGTSTNLIIFQNWAGTGTPVVTSTGGSVIFNMYNKTYLRISGFKFLIYGSDIGIYVYYSNTSNVNNVIKNNVFVGEGMSAMGIRIFASKGVAVYNNTFYHLSFGVYISYPGNTGDEHIPIKNNIFTSCNTQGYSSAINYDNGANSNVDEDYNLFWDNRVNLTGNSPTLGAHDYKFDPLFTDTSTYDLSLKSTSPAINSGYTTASVTTDILSNVRPLNGAYDMGAYEYSETPETPVFISSLPSIAEFRTVDAGAPSLISSIFNPVAGAIVGHYYRPTALAINKTTGIIYVGDDNSNVIVKFDLLGNQYDGFGGGGQNMLGAESGRFAIVRGIAIDSFGNAYVSDMIRNRIQKFDVNGNFIVRWGSSGTANGEFDMPRAIAIDSSNNLYIADYNNNRIQKFSSNGVFLSKWGSTGTGDGQFTHPEGIAIDSAGNIYVTDVGNNRIQKFDSNGTFIKKWGSTGTGDGQFSSPTEIAIDSLNNIYVVDFGNYRIQKFDSNGTFITKWGGSTQFTNSIYSIAIDALDRVYVAEQTLGRIQQFDSSGNLLNVIMSQGSGDGQFYRTYGVAVDKTDNMYIVDSGNGRIQKFNSSGAFLSKWGSAGSENGQISGAMGIAVDSLGNVYVAEQGNQRIQKFDSSGTYITKWGSAGNGNGQFSNPVSVSVDKDDNVYVADSNNTRIQKFTSNGTYIKSWTLNGPADGVTFDVYGNMFTSDYACIISKFDPSGVFVKSWGGCGVDNGKFYEPTSLTTDSYGNVYVADSANNRIQMFDNEGNFITKWGFPGSASGDLNNPIFLAVDSTNRIIVSDKNNHRIQIFKDMTAPVVTFNASISSLTGTSIAWTTDEKASTKIDYGLSNWYLRSTTESDTLLKVNSHSVSLSGLKPCTTYHYKLRSKDYVVNERVDADRTFTTLGCTGDATVMNQATSNVYKSLGGSLSLLDTNSNGLTLTIPSSFSMYDADFQIKELGKEPVIQTTSTPHGYLTIGSSIYDIKAYADMDTTVSSFDRDLDITISYETSDIKGMNETSLRIYSWDGTTWSRLPNCFINIFANTVTCTTDHFSLFGLFGQVASAEDNPEEEETSNEVVVETPTEPTENPIVKPNEDVKSSGSDTDDDKSTNTNWTKILIYSGIGLVIVCVVGLVIKKRNE